MLKFQEEVPPTARLSLSSNPKPTAPRSIKKEISSVRKKKHTPTANPFKMPTSSAKNKKAPPRERPVFGHRTKSGGRSDSWMGAKPKMEWGECKTPLDKGRGISVTDVTVHRTADADKGFVHSSAKDHVKNRMDEDEGEYVRADRVQLVRRERSDREPPREYIQYNTITLTYNRPLASQLSDTAKTPAATATIG